jgi:hypothetical protein
LGVVERSGRLLYFEDSVLAKYFIQFSPRFGYPEDPFDLLFVLQVLLQLKDRLVEPQLLNGKQRLSDLL